MKNINDPMGLLESILESIDQHAAGPELKDAKELENKATEEKEPVELASDADNKDVYPADEHKQEEDVDAVVVESEQVAAGPELEASKELENEATDEKAAEPEAKELDNKDVFSSDEHEEAEDLEAIIKEDIDFICSLSDEEIDNLVESIYDNDPEYGDLLFEECDNIVNGEILNENVIKDLRFKRANYKLYRQEFKKGKLEHKSDADAKFNSKENQEKRAELKDKLRDVRSKFINGEAGIKEVIRARRDYSKTGKHQIRKDVNKEQKTIAKDAQKSRALQYQANKVEEAQNKVDKFLKKPNTDKDSSASSQTSDKQVNVTESTDFELMCWLNENGYEPSLENVKILREQGLDICATDASEAETLAPETDNKDVYSADEHKEKEDVEEVVVEGKINEAELETNPVVKDAEDAGVASDEKAEDGKDMEDEDKAEESKDEDEAVAKEDKADEDKDEDEKEDSEDMNESMNAVFALLDKINESVQNAAGPELEAGKELENEATDEKAPEAVASEADNKDVYSADEHEQKEEVEGVVVESEQVAAGPELEANKELENEATEEKDPVVAEPDTDNKDVYCDVCHKQVEDVVEVVIEAASRCKSNGVKATKENIIKEAKQLLEAEEVALKVEKPAEKEYDVDASVESAEMNGNDEKFESYDDIQGDGSKAAKDEESEVKPEDIHESVNYKSLREACLLDEGYFMTDSYIKETADEKQTKLTEQVSLLMARDAMDPMYDELLRESIHCMRLQEALVKKYGSEAAKRADMIINK